MTYLIDSDVLIDWLKGQQETVALLTQLATEDLAISTITLAEVLEGALFGRHAQSDQERLEAFVGTVEVLPVGPEIAERFARFRGQLRAEGRLIPDREVVLDGGRRDELVTRNLRHFERVPGLQLLDRGQ